MFLNLLLLLGVTVAPFPTALVAAHYSAGDRILAEAVFNGTYFVAIFFNLLWFHAVKSGLLDAAAIESAGGISRRYGSGSISMPRLFWPHLDQRAGQSGAECGAGNLLCHASKGHFAGQNDADCNEIVAFLDSPSVR